MLKPTCDSPYYVLPSKAATEKIPVPCGKCPICKARRVNQWVFRLMQEEKVSISAHFVTLTYDTRYVPISNNGFMTLRKKDFQDYMKRLRKLTDVKLKYYAVGEYGSQNKRPHFHAIIFGVTDEKLFADAWGINGEQFGGIFVGKVTTDSVAYTMKYIDKPSTLVKKYSRDDRSPEFSLMSKGLGASYITDATRKYHKDDLTRNYVNKLSGHRVPMPRYYRNKILSDIEKAAQVDIIQVAIADAQNYDRTTYSGSISYEQAQDSARQQRYKSFYNKNKKVRSL